MKASRCDSPKRNLRELPRTLECEFGGLFCRPDKAFTSQAIRQHNVCPDGVAYRAYGPFLSPTDTNLLSGCKLAIPK